MPTSSLCYCVTHNSIEFTEEWYKTSWEITTIYFRDMTYIWTNCALYIQFRNAGQLLLRPVIDLNCVLSFVLRKYEGKKFKWRLQTKVIRDVNKNRKKNMFISCADYVAYRGLAESFHWSDHLSDRLCVHHKCWQCHIHFSRSKLWEKDSMNGLR